MPFANSLQTTILKIISPKSVDDGNNEYNSEMNGEPQSSGKGQATNE
jgi:hypothetical protein